MQKIKWEYCECGCHCNIVSLNGSQYSYLLEWDKDTAGKSDYSKEHHYLMIDKDYKWKEFKNKKELEKFVREDAIKNLKKFKKQLFNR